MTPRAMTCLRAPSRCALIFLWLCLLPSRSEAQPSALRAYAMAVHGVPLHQALEELARIAGIDLVYSSRLVAGVEVYCARRKATVEELLRCVLAGTGLDFMRSSSGAYLIVASPEVTPGYGHLAGSIVDGETGEPLPYASVLLADAAAGTTTNEDGLFSFADVLSGPHRVVVSSLGYVTAVDSVWVEPGHRQRVQVTLRPEPFVMEPIIVDGLARQPSRALGSGVVARPVLTSASSTATPDVARSAGRLPGVAVPQPLADLHIQGGAAGEHLTLLDGVPVRNPVSMGRYYGAFSPLALKRLTVHTAGFGAAQGSHLSGSVVVEHDVAGSDVRGLALSVDPISVNGTVHVGWEGTSGRSLALMTALRSSVWRVYHDSGFQDLLGGWSAVDPTLAALWRSSSQTSSTPLRQHQEPRVAFSDVHAAARLNLSPFQVAYASFYRGSNYLATERATVSAVDDDAGTTAHQFTLIRSDYDWLNDAAQVRYSRLFSSRSVATFHARGSRHASRYAYFSARDQANAFSEPLDVLQRTYQSELEAAPSSDEHNTVEELTLLAELSHSLAPHQHVEVGVSVGRTASDFQLGNLFIAPFSHRATVWDAAGYLSGTFQLSPSTVVEPGLRLTRLSSRSAVYAEPRLALRHDRRWRAEGNAAFRLAAGVYRQFVGQFEVSSTSSTSVVPAVLFWLPTASTLAPPRAYHVAAEALLAPGPRWSMDVNAYYKAQPRLLALDYARLMRTHPAARPAPPAEPLRQDAFVSPVRGRAYGGSLRLRRSGPGLAPTLAYSFSRALRQYPDRFDGRLVVVPWNARHRLTLGATTPVLAGLALDAGWTGAWGRRWGLRQAYYDYLAVTPPSIDLAPFDLDEPDRHRLPPYYRLDLGLSFERAWDFGDVRVRLAALNVLDRRNVYDLSLEPQQDGTDPMNRLLPGRHVVLSVRFQR